MESSEFTSLLPEGHVTQHISRISILFLLQDDPPFSGCVCIPRDLPYYSYTDTISSFITTIENCLPAGQLPVLQIWVSEELPAHVAPPFAS